MDKYYVFKGKITGVWLIAFGPDHDAFNRVVAATDTWSQAILWLKEKGVI